MLEFPLSFLTQAATDMYWKQVAEFISYNSMASEGKSRRVTRMEVIKAK